MFLCVFQKSPVFCGFHFNNVISGNFVFLNRILILMLLVCSVAVALPAPAFPDMGSIAQDSPDTPWHIAADEISYDKNIDQYIARGHVTISQEARRLSADFVRFDHKTNMAYASGHVMMTAGEDVMTGSSMNVNLASETGTLYEGTIFIKENHFYIRGNTLRKVGKKSYTADSASVSTCDGDTPDWKITGKHIAVTIEGYGTIEHAALWAKQMPVLYTPYMMFPAKTKRQSGFLTPEIGFSQRDGSEYSQPFYWAINDWSDATMYLEHIAMRGEKTGVEYRYVLDPESKGIFMLDYLKDRQINDGTPSSIADWGYTGETTPRTNTDRYWLRMKSDQTLPLGFSAKLDLDIVSDQDYLRDFQNMYLGYNDSNANFNRYFGRGLDDYNSAVRTNRLNVSKYWSGYSLNTEALWYDNVVARQTGAPDSSLQQLPSLQFYGSPKFIYQTPILVGFSSEVDNFYRQSGETGQRADVYPRMYYPWQYKQYFTLEPSVGVRETAWYAGNNENGPSATMTRNIYDLNLDMSSEISRVFSVDGENIEKIKHTIVPKLSYTYIPETSQISYPYFDQLDRIAEQNLVTCSVTNTFTSKSRPPKNLEGRSPDAPIPYAYNEFLRVELDQSYDIHEAQQTNPQPFLPLYGEAQFMPYKYLSFQTDAEWSHYDNAFKSRNIGAMVMDPRQDRIFTEYRYQKDSSESVYTNLLVSLSERLQAYTDYEMNAKDSQRIESGVGVRYQSQCWSVDLRYMDEMSDHKFMFLISLSGLGGFGGTDNAFGDYSGHSTVFNAPYQVIRNP